MKRFIFLFLLCGCGSYGPKDNSHIITSMQIIDRNGFAETISNKDRIGTFKHVDFLRAQPYQKVLRVFGRDGQGRSTAKVTSYHENGQLWHYLEVVDGRAHGFYREYYPNGYLKIESCVIEGLADINDTAKASFVFDKESRVFNDHGQLIAQIHYEKGELSAPSLYYHDNGHLQKIIPYTQGNIEGDVCLYDENDCLIEKIPYLAGVKHGLARRFWEGESVQYEELYEKGILQEASYYDPSHTLVAEIKQGEGKQALFTGQTLEAFIQYAHGIPEGEVQFFFPDGSLHSTYYIKEGMKNGPEIEYYPSNLKEKPKPKLFVHWHDDILQGIVKTWYPNGEMESQREIISGKKQGLCFAWYKNGDLMLMEEYENDLIVKASYFKKGDKTPLSKIEAGKGTATLYTADGIFIKKIAYEKGKPKLGDDTL
jgi:antitoxin component YwqK of YwqJK toxin-antitoxin module